MTGPTVQIEAWIMQRLSVPGLFAGVTTPEERRDRVRTVIINRGLEMAIAGRRQGASCETWSQLFERVYKQTLVSRGTVA